MLLLENNSIYESRMGYPVYYHNGNINGYQPPTPPPYSATTHQWEEAKATGFNKSEREELFAYHQHLVYPQFPTPPLSVSPSPSPQPLQRPGDSFQIKRLLNLDEPLPTAKYPDEDHHHQSPSFAMRTASVIMKIEDQRVFQVDSTTTALTDDDSSFDQHNNHHHQHHLQQQYSPELKSSVVASTENLFICKWEKCYK